MIELDKCKDYAAIAVSAVTVLTLYSLSSFDFQPLPIFITIIFGLYRTIKSYSYLKMVALTLRRDLWYLKIYFLRIYLPGKFHQYKNSVVPSIFEENVKMYPNKVCFYFEGVSWTFKQISEMSNQVAHVFNKGGFRRGETVALFMENRPEYVAIWIGLSKLGIITALVNTNLRETSLLHALATVNLKALIFGTSLCDAVESVKDHLLNTSILMYGFGKISDNKMPEGAINMNILLRSSSNGPMPRPEGYGYHDIMLYIYTSGTTGLPKAAPIKHFRFLFAAYGCFYSAQLRREDTIYVTLPLYHTAGGMAGVGNALIFGCTVVLRNKFSVSQFWAECIRFECTAFQYIGEMCRYLLSVSSKPEEKNHNIRIMFGNGLRPQIWEEFTHRFNIPNVLEIYGSTEGTSSICNNTGQVGAVGAISLIAPSLFPLAVIHVSEENGLPKRGQDGLCIRCKPGDCGMLISKIKTKNIISDLPGYTDAEATSKTIIKDVFNRGDSYFLSSDIMSVDELGYLYFKDRIGDTFRWKSENVSASEVEAIISNLAQHRECCVYGVKIPGFEGKAGMAAIVDAKKDLDLYVLTKQMGNTLPVYARPLFIRFVNSIDLTETYKLRKIHYRREAYDLSKVSDPIFFLESISQTYIPFTPCLYKKLISGKIRV